MQDSPVYAAAVVLNPEHKWKFFRRNWEQYPDWIAQAEEDVMDLWESMYQGHDSSTGSATAAGLDAGLFRPARQDHSEPSDFDKRF